MEKNVYLKEWTKEGDKVRLTYHDGTVVYVKADKFSQAFGPIVSGEKSAIIRDFAISVATV